MELEAILEVGKVLTSSFDLEQNLSAAMKILSSLLEMQRGCVYLLDRDTKALRIVAAFGLSQEEIKRGRYRVGEGIVGRVIESGSPVFVPNIGEELMFLNRTGSRPEKNGISFLSMPIRLKDETLGLISVDRIYSEEHGDEEDDLRVLRIVASLIAQFVRLWENYKQVENERETLRAELKDKFSLPNLVGESERFQAVLKAVYKAAGTDATVLLLGESGTGKELIARTLHYQSRRAKGPFVAVNCAALPENLLEAELFGCEKGAFTGATARRMGRFEISGGGTIFLDEIAELSFGIQAKLLRVLQEHAFERVGSSATIKADVRVIAATNKDLEAEVRKGRFREDLYWRLNVIPVVLPPLRQRAEDIPLLAAFYLKKFNGAYGKKFSVSAGAMESLVAYAWPGNVRELANTLERIVIMAEGDVIGRKDLPYNITGGGLDAPPNDAEKHPGADITLPGEVGMIERARIVKALEENGMVRHKAARALGLTPRQIGYKIRKYGIKLK